MQYTVLSPKAIWWGAGMIVLVGVGLAVSLLWAFGKGDDQARNQLEAIKTAGAIVIGAGGAVALLLAARRQRAAEIALIQKDRDQADVARAHALQERIAAETRAHQERVAAATEADAAARRITDLYTKAVEQLGSDKAPVRLGGLYALERLAQDNAEQRQTIVNVLCAYLRMPYQPPGPLPIDHSADNNLLTIHQERMQEREVRLAAQRLLRDHLSSTPATRTTFWADIDLDLTGAILIDFSLDGCEVRAATFRATNFVGYASFADARFTSGTTFNNATFPNADFQGATFVGDAFFESATFEDVVLFGVPSPLLNARSATFKQFANFSRAKFKGIASFIGATFDGRASFDSWRPDERTTFSDAAHFDDAAFNAAASFQRAKFGRVASFQRAKFATSISFRRAVFATADFDDAVFPDEPAAHNGPRSVDFGHAQFSEAVPYEVNRFLSQP